MSSIQDFTIIKTIHENEELKSKILLATYKDISEPKFIIRVIHNQQFKDLELKIHTTLKHRKLIKYINHFKDDTYTYIVLEHAPIDLLDYIKTHSLTIPQVSYIIRQILEVTQYLHFNNIAHMDIKPENIVVFPNHKVKLIDFGLAREFKSILHSAIGTPDYFSPEMNNLLDQDIDSISVSENTDIWCIGCLTYELIFDRPFKYNIIKDIQHPNKHVMSFLNNTLIKQTPIKKLLVHPFIQ
jgi:serine/threonine protein kinase